MARLLVTGSTGFIGRHMVRRLVEHGHEARCLVRETSNRAPLEPYSSDFAVGDMGRPETLGAAVEGCDGVIHLASLLKVPWKPEFLTVNAGGTRNVAESLRGIVLPAMGRTGTVRHRLFRLLPDSTRHTFTRLCWLTVTAVVTTRL